jgi:hypothetical protein
LADDVPEGLGLMAFSDQCQRVQAEGRKRRESTKHADDQKHPGLKSEVQTAVSDGPSQYPNCHRAQHIHEKDTERERTPKHALMHDVIQGMASHCAQSTAHTDQYPDCHEQAASLTEKTTVDTPTARRRSHWPISQRRLMVDSTTSRKLIQLYRAGSTQGHVRHDRAVLEGRRPWLTQDPNYWRENLRITLQTWDAWEVMGALVLALLPAFGYSEYAVLRPLAIGGVSMLVIWMLVASPWQLWARRDPFPVAAEMARNPACCKPRLLPTVFRAVVTLGNETSSKRLKRAGAAHAVRYDY